MYYNLKNKILLFLTDIRRSFWITTVYVLMVPFFILLSFAQAKSAMTVGIPCMADYIATLNYGYLLDIIIVPMSLMLIINIISQNDTVNFLIRQKNKQSLILIQYIDILILSIFLSIYCVIIAAFVSGLFSSITINWNDNASYFYLSLDYTMDINFAKVVLLTIIKKFFTFYLFSCVYFTLSLLLKQVFCYFIIIFLLSINIFRYITFYLTTFLNLPQVEQRYISTPYMILLFFIIPIICFLSILLSLRLIKRKDFL